MISSFFDDIEPFIGLNGTYKNGISQPFLIGDYIKKMVNAIAQIDIGVSGFAIHHLCSFGAQTVICMAGFVVTAAVGFRFCNDTRCKIPVKKSSETLSDQLSAYVSHIGVCIKRFRQYVGWRSAQEIAVYGFFSMAGACCRKVSR